MASSKAYWDLAEGLKERLAEFGAEADGLYSELESNDDPGELANGLDRLKLGLRDLASLLEDAIPFLVEANSALANVPDVSATRRVTKKES